MDLEKSVDRSAARLNPIGIPSQSQVSATWTSLNDTASEKHVERMAEMAGSCPRWRPCFLGWNTGWETTRVHRGFTGKSIENSRKPWEKGMEMMESDQMWPDKLENYRVFSGLTWRTMGGNYPGAPFQGETSYSPLDYPEVKLGNEFPKATENLMSSDCGQALL